MSAQSPLVTASSGTSHLTPRAYLALATMITVTIGIAISALGPALPSVAASLHRPLAELGILYSANFLCSLLATLAAAPLISVWGQRRILCIALICDSAGLFSMAVAPNLGVIVLASALQGVGVGMDNVIVNTAMVLLFTTRSAGALNLLNGFFGLGSCLAPIATGYAISQSVAAHSDPSLGARTVFAVDGVIVILCLIPLLLRGLPCGSQVPAATAKEDQGDRRLSWWRMLALDSFRRRAATLFLYLGVEIGFGAWIFSYAQTTNGVGSVVAGWLTGTFWLALTLGSLATVLALRRFHSRHILIAGIAGATVAASVLLAFGTNLAIIVATTILIGFCIAPIMPLTLTTGTQQVPPRDAATASAVLFMSGQVGAIILPWLQGLLLVNGPSWAIALTVSGCAAMLVLTIWPNRE